MGMPILGKSAKALSMDTRSLSSARSTYIVAHGLLTCTFSPSLSALAPIQHVMPPAPQQQQQLAEAPHYNENDRYYGTYRKGQYLFPVDEVWSLDPHCIV